MVHNIYREKISITYVKYKVPKEKQKALRLYLEANFYNYEVLANTIFCSILQNDSHRKDNTIKRAFIHFFWDNSMIKAGYSTAYMSCLQ